MAYVFSGYVLEKPRVGASNSPYTLTPDNRVSDQGAFDAAYPADESVPENDYMVLPLSQGALATSSLGWTRNDGSLLRFSYDGLKGSFYPLPGRGRDTVGVISDTSNTTRLKVPSPPVAPLGGVQPVRLVVGTSSFAVVAVADDSSFTSPLLLPSATVEVSLATGNLNWSDVDLTIYAGDTVYWQGQKPEESYSAQVALGLLDGVTPRYLNPLPATGHYPLLRVGDGLWLTPVEVPNEGAFGIPASGTFQWASDTGRVKFASDIEAIQLPSYYDGILLGAGLTVPSSPLGTLQASRLTSGLAPLSFIQEGTDLWVRVGLDQVQLPYVTFVDALDPSYPGVSGNVEVVRSTGQVRFSASDTALYTGEAVTLYTGDLPLEKGQTLRLFRSYVNLSATNPDLKDVANLYTTQDALWAKPILGTPDVVLPLRPVDDRLYSDAAWLSKLGLPPTADPATGRLEVQVTQGSGSFVGLLKRLDPPIALPDTSALGYILDGQKLTFTFASRVVNQISALGKDTRTYQLPDPLLVPGTVSLALETFPSSNVYSPLVLGADVDLDYPSGFLTFTTSPGALRVAPQTTGVVLIPGVTFQDTTQNFLASGVLPGDVLIVREPSSISGAYTVNSAAATTLTVGQPFPIGASSVVYEVRRPPEVLVDRTWTNVSTLDPSTQVERLTPLGTIANVPPYTVDPGWVGRLRFRLGGSSFTALATSKPDDASLTPAALLPQGQVEVSLATGHVRFSQLDVNLAASLDSALLLVAGVDFRVSPVLGYFDFATPFLSGEEMTIRYIADSTGALVTEPGGFLVRKEQIEIVVETSTVTFDPAGLPLASNPPPKVFRGSRPLVNGTQVAVDLNTRTIKVLPSSQVTNFFPHGNFKPGENVYVDYYILRARGGERSITVLQPPIRTAPATITLGASSFTLAGDRTTELLPGQAIRVNGGDVYLLDTVTYDPGTSLSTVNLRAPQVFRQGATGVTLERSSGVLRMVAVSPSLPAFFELDPSLYQAAPTGSQRITLVGDRVTSYPPGTLLLLQSLTTLDLYQVGGSEYTQGTTVLTLDYPLAREAQPGVSFLARSVRPVYPGGTLAFQASAPLVGDSESLVIRSTEGQRGVLVDPKDYLLDSAGSLLVSDTLGDNESLSLAYKGYRAAGAGKRIQATYTRTIAPSATNGLSGQVLQASYTAWSPDTFYDRVEKLSTLRAEVARRQQEEAQASIPTVGPRLSNRATPSLAEQGRESLFYPEGRAANDDLAFRSYLLFTNTLINYLEDVRQDATGIVVGNQDGRFRFDGSLTNPPVVTVRVATNQIDDRYLIAPGPYTVTGPPFVVLALGTYASAWSPAPQSRVFKTAKNVFGVSTGGSSDGDPLLDLGVKNVTGLLGIKQRQPWALTTEATSIGNTLTVDTTAGSSDLIRPAFSIGQKVTIQDRGGAVLAGSPYEVAALTATTLTFTGLLAGPVAEGATVYQADSDLSYYQEGKDVGLAPEQGVLTYIKPFPPLDGSVPLVPSALEVHSPPVGEALTVGVSYALASLSPDKAPALYGQGQDDSGDLAFPVLNPSFDCEANAFGKGRLQGVLDSVSAIQAVTTAPLTFTADLPSLVTLQRTAGVFPAPVPLVGQVVRILTGTNGQTSWHRITGVTPTTLTVETPFASLDSGVNAEVGVSSFALTGVGTILAGTTLESIGANFQTNGVLPGYTVVILTGPDTYERRQVASIPDEDHLILTSLLGNNLVGFRVENPLVTYSDLTSLTGFLGALEAILETNLGPVYSEKEALLAAFDLIFTDRVPNPTAVTVNVGPGTLTAAIPLVGSVRPGDVAFFLTGPNRGAYQIANVVGNVATVSGTLTANGPDSVRMAGAYGVSLAGLNSMLGFYQQVEASIATKDSLNTLFATVPVLDSGGLPSPSMYGNGAEGVLLASLLADVVAQQGLAATLEADVYGFLLGQEGLYDKRYAWLDGRLNRQTGTLAKIVRALARRQQAQVDLPSQLYRLLALQTNPP